VGGGEAEGEGRVAEVVPVDREGGAAEVGEEGGEEEGGDGGGVLWGG